VVTNSHRLKQEYQLRFGRIAAYRNAVWEILCADFFSRYIDANATVLDLGAGWGEFINNITAARKLAMDLNPETGSHVSEGVTFLHQDCSQEWHMEAETLDIVFTSNFLEHLTDKPALERTLHEACRCLRPNGLIICLGPNIKYIPGAYWDFWDHVIPLTELSISELLRMVGFEITCCIARFLPYSMSAGKTPPLYLIKLYLRMPHVWQFFGKQFLVIGRKIGPDEKASNMPLQQTRPSRA